MPRGRHKGYFHSEETKRKISVRHKGRKLSLSWREKIRRKLMGRKLSPETLKKLADWRAGNQKRGKDHWLYGKPNKATYIAYERIEKEIPELEKQGFRCIPITRVIPDIIAIKDNKIYAIEIEYGSPDYEKYTEEIKSRFDDVLWILRRQ